MLSSTINTLKESKEINKIEELKTIPESTPINTARIKSPGGAARQ